MEGNLAQLAIKNALQGNWERARELNEKILEARPKDVDALNRLAKAYSKLGKFKKARSIAKKVLEIDEFNTIAQKSLERWENVDEEVQVETGTNGIHAFLEIPGKTSVVRLMNTGDAKLLARLDSSDEVIITCHNHRVTVTTPSGKYVGRFPDDIAARVRNLMKHGNEYKAFIKTVDKEEVTVFVKESKRSDELANIPSFSSEKVDYIAFTPPELVSKKDPLIYDEEELEEV